MVKQNPDGGYQLESVEDMAKHLYKRNERSIEWFDAMMREFSYDMDIEFHRRLKDYRDILQRENDILWEQL